MIRIIISGINGRIGQVLSASIEKNPKMELAAGVDVFPEAKKNSVPVYEKIADVKEAADVIIDFSRPTALEGNLAYAKERGLAIIIATTGYTPEDKQRIYDAAKDIPVFFSANMSLGVNMQFELVREVADFYGDAVDIEIIEKHHNVKVDSPSGTALALADIINETYDNSLTYKYGRTPEDGRRKKNELGIHSVRGGTFVGEHDVLFITDSEVLTVSHAAQTKQVFADGALRAAEFMADKEPGLYSMKDIVYQTRTVTGVKRTDGVSLITVKGGKGTSFAGEVLEKVAEQGIVVDVILMGEGAGLSFSVPEKDEELTLSVLSGYEARAVGGLSKIAVEGLGMELMHGVATRIFTALNKSGVEAQAVTTSETRIEFLVESGFAETAAHAVAKESKLRNTQS